MKGINFSEPVNVILAAGAFPKKGSQARRMLESAKRVICCDSAADMFRRHCKREPYAVVGDCDSVKGRFKTVVKIDEQDTNDLSKAVRFCRENGFEDVVILGATGKRDDHSLGNIFRALDFSLDVVTDYGWFTALKGSKTYNVKPGVGVSIFAPDSKTKMTSKGLKWPLNGVKFENLYCATLNRTLGEEVSLTATERVYIYFSFK
ncbi:MAG: thiamine diphosphokinase [Kiritimatiellae bacterium]|nr:thiamine diphosphokinase [Kiritimatiellia bacterium]